MSDSGERSMETLGLIIFGVSSTLICAAAIHRRRTHLRNLERERQGQAAAAAAAAEGVSGRILEEQRRRGNQAGLPAEIRKSIPVTVYDAGSVSARSRHSVEGKEGNCCAICLVDYEAGDKLLELPCHHAFHVVCLDAWLQGSCTCPVCRLSLLPPAVQAAAAAPSLEAAAGAAAAEGVALDVVQGGREPSVPDVESNAAPPAHALAVLYSPREDVVGDGLPRVREDRSLHAGERDSVGEYDVERGERNEGSIGGDVAVEVVEVQQSARRDRGDGAQGDSLSFTAREEGLSQRGKDGLEASARALSLERDGDVGGHRGILGAEASVSHSMEGENAAGGAVIRIKDEDGIAGSSRWQLAGSEVGRLGQRTDKQAKAGDGGS